VVDELERTQATLAKQEKLYVTYKKALAPKRIEVETLRLEVDQAESVIATLKDDLNTLQEKNNALKTRNEEPEEQFSILQDKTSHPTKASEISNASTTNGCDRCYNVDLEACATNLANMEAMKKEIAILNNIIASGCMDDASKKPKFIQGRHPFIKDGLGRIDLVTLREARPARGTW
jgi:chromosome segregation ATPase